MYCSECGKEITEDSMFCNHCGNRIEREQRKKLGTVRDNEKSAQSNLKPKDGKYHVVLIKSRSKSAYDNIQVLELEYMLEEIQRQGYEIVDIKIMGVQRAGGTIGSEVLVVYK